MSREKIFILKGKTLNQVLKREINKEVFEYDAEFKEFFYNSVMMLINESIKKAVPKYKNRLYRSFRAKITKFNKRNIIGQVASYGLKYARTMNDGVKAPYYLSKKEIEGSLKKWVYDKIVKTGGFKNFSTISYFDTMNKSEKAKAIAWVIANKFEKEGMKGRKFYERGTSTRIQRQAENRVIEYFRKK